MGSWCGGGGGGLGRGVDWKHRGASHDISQLKNSKDYLFFYHQELVEVIEKYHGSHHLLDMLTEVTRRVVDYQNRVFNSAAYRVQVPAPAHTLTKLLFLWVDWVRVQKKEKKDAMAAILTHESAKQRRTKLMFREIYYDYIEMLCFEKILSQNANFLY